MSFSDKIFLDNNPKATDICLMEYFIAVHCKILFSGHLFAPYQKLEDLGGNVRGVLGPCLVCPLSLGSRVPGPRVPGSPEGSKGGNAVGFFWAHAWLVPSGGTPSPFYGMDQILEVEKLHIFLNFTLKELKQSYRISGGT